MFDASRAVLAAEFPRRKFETYRTTTVGGLKAFNGNYWTGADRYLGLAQIEELTKKQRLGFVQGEHFIARNHGRTEPSERDGATLYVQVRVEFTRPVRWPGADLGVQIGADWEHHVPALSDAVWQTFCDLVDMAPVTSALGYWDRHQSVTLPDGEFPIGSIVHLPEGVVASFGGADEAARALSDAHVDRATRGLAVRLWRLPQDITAEGLSTAAQLLRDHGMPRSDDA